MCAVYASYIPINRTACMLFKTSDNLALSDVFLIIEKWPKSSSKTPKITSRRPQLRFSARRVGVMFPRRRCQAQAPPSLAGGGETPAHLASLADRARGYVQAASSANTRKAYAADWKHFSAWCRRSNLAPAPHPQTIGLYITACASGTAERGAKANSVSTIERRLSSLSWNYAERGLSLDRRTGISPP